MAPDLLMHLDMDTQSRNSRFWTGVPPWIFIGAAIVLLPIIIIMTVTNIHREQENSTRLLVDKGAALIRAFEAGTRTGTGMMGEGWSNFQLQRLLVATAQQPDIVHLVLADVDGTIVADNDPARIGQTYGRHLDLRAVSNNGTPRWRQVVDPGGKHVLEVYQRFRPMGSGGGFHRGMMMMRRQMGSDGPDQARKPVPQVIFVGLDMTGVAEAGAADARHTVVMAVIMMLVGMAGIILLFVTQSYRAARVSLSRIKAFSDTIVDNMPIGLVVIDPKDRIASLNPVARRILDLSDAAILGREAAEMLPAELWEAARVAEETAELEVDCTMAAGRSLPLAMSASRLTDEKGTVIGRVLLIKDLSEEQALRREVARSHRLASVGRLAAGVAHEIRNPLSSIKGFATYFKERYRQVPEDQQIAGIMIQEVDRLNRVVGQLLELARPVSINQRPTALGPLVTESLKLVAGKAEEGGVRIDSHISEGLEDIFVDPDRIRQVLLNLLLNAVEAMDDGAGVLTVEVADACAGGIKEIRISDTGMGIGAENLPHVFDPYFTTKPTGTGLGLAIAHSIIEAHGGQIHIESQPGRGTTVTVALPATEPSRKRGST